MQSTHKARFTFHPLLFSFISACALLAIVALLLAPHPALADMSCGGSDISGTVFRDFDADGFRDDNELGVSEIEVIATGASGNSVTCLTGPSGAYGLTIETTDFPVRLEFTWEFAYLHPGAHGADSETTVTFVDDRQQFVDVAVANPTQYCQPEPDLAVSCYVMGVQQALTREVLVDFPYDAGAPMTTIGYEDYLQPTTHDLAVLADQIGATYGLAYAQSLDTLYAGAFMRRHTGFGPDGPGAIYAIDAGSGESYTLTTLNAGDDPHPEAEDFFDWLRDGPEAFDAVGKRGLGDIDITPDETALWVTNLYERALYRVEIADPSAPVSYTLSAENAVAAGCANGGDNAPDLRPFGLGVHKDTGVVYWGVTCSNESGENQLTGHVFALDPADVAAGFELQVTIPLTYTRGCVHDAGGLILPGTQDCALNGPIDEFDVPAAWEPWNPNFDSSGASRPEFGADDLYTGGIQIVGDPQPWIQDIEFLSNNDMVIGLGDRFSYQMGYRAFGPNEGDNQLYSVASGGDILRLCRNNLLDTWVLESDGECGLLVTDGRLHLDGPGGGEFYYEESFPVTFNPPGLSALHDETALGALAYVPGSPDFLSTAFNASNAGENFGPNSGYLDGGVRWMSTDLGSALRGYVLYDTDFEPPLDDPFTFGKAAGLGDLEAMCEAPPLEIGNFVWYDLDLDGIQDPDEPRLSGIAVDLFLPDGTLLASTETDLEGRYYFDVNPHTAYILAFDNFDLLTFENLGENDLIDSDAVMAGNLGNPWDGRPIIEVTSGGPGHNDHTLDVGFISSATSVELHSLGGERAARLWLVWAAVGVGVLVLGWQVVRRRSVQA